MAPINLPDGSQVSEIVLPDGSTASEVLAPDGTSVFGNAIPDSVTHHWPIDEGSGATMFDDVGNADATISGPSWVSGTYQGGYALDSDGTDDYVDLTTLGDFGSTMDQGFAWVFTFETTGSNSLFGVTDGNQEFSINTGNSAYGADGAVAFEIDDNGNSNTEAVRTDSTGFADGARYRCVCQTGDATASTHEIWINGSEETTTTTASQGGSSYVDFSNAIYMFADNGKGRHISATIDNALIFDGKLTATEIQDDYNRQPWS